MFLKLQIWVNWFKLIWIIDWLLIRYYGFASTHCSVWGRRVKIKLQSHFHWLFCNNSCCCSVQAQDVLLLSVWFPPPIGFRTISRVSASRFTSPSIVFKTYVANWRRGWVESDETICSPSRANRKLSAAAGAWKPDASMLRLHLLHPPQTPRICQSPAPPLPAAVPPLSLHPSTCVSHSWNTCRRATHTWRPQGAPLGGDGGPNLHPSLI